ncbi:hypothetical protein V6Z12_D06G188200 [Gossypium hirsutum]
MAYATLKTGDARENGTKKSQIQTLKGNAVIIPDKRHQILMLADLIIGHCGAVFWLNEEDKFSNDQHGIFMPLCVTIESNPCLASFFDFTKATLLHSHINTVRQVNKTRIIIKQQNKAVIRVSTRLLNCGIWFYISLPKI